MAMVILPGRRGTRGSADSDAAYPRMAFRLFGRPAKNSGAGGLERHRRALQEEIRFRPATGTGQRLFSQKADRVILLHSAQESYPLSSRRQQSSCLVSASRISEVAHLLYFCPSRVSSLSRRVCRFAALAFFG